MTTARIDELTAGPTWLPDEPALRDRIIKWHSLALIPAREREIRPEAIEDVDMAAWNHVGDPLATGLMESIYAAGLHRTDLWQAIDHLLALEDPATLRFIESVTHVPDFLRFEDMHASVGFATRNPLGLIGGVYAGLPFSYIDESVARGLASTSRLTDTGDMERRIWETLSGVLTSWDVEGLAPWGDAWKTWVRIRVMHTRVRMALEKGARWDWSLGGPISQIGLAFGIQLFADFRSNVKLGMGGWASQQELAATVRVWQWIAYVMGAPIELVGRSITDQRYIDRRVFEIYYRPGATSRRLTENLMGALAAMPGLRICPRAVHEALGRYAIRHGFKRLISNQEGYDIVADLGLKSRPVLESLIGLFVIGLRAANQTLRIPVIGRAFERAFAALAHRVVNRGLRGMAAQYTTPH